MKHTFRTLAPSLARRKTCQGFLKTQELSQCPGPSSDSLRDTRNELAIKNELTPDSFTSIKSEKFIFSNMILQQSDEREILLSLYQEIPEIATCHDNIQQHFFLLAIF